MSDAADTGQAWVLLAYTLPREPSAPRVALWRKLKKLGAVLVHDAVWILPATPATREQMRWLAQEIREAGGEAQVWVARGELPEQDAQLVSLFSSGAERRYREIMRALDDPMRSRAELARIYRRVRDVDYFHVPSSDVVRARLESMGSAEGDTEHTSHNGGGTA